MGRDQIIILKWDMIYNMEGRKGHNSVLLFKLQFKHLYIRIYYFVTFIILILSLLFYYSNIRL